MFWKKENKTSSESAQRKFIWRGFSATDIGMVRSQNEDAVFLSTRFGEKEFALAIVCDGMGGHAAGDVASQLCIQSISDYLKDKTPTTTLLKLALENANSSIFEYAQENPQHKGMGTTCSALLVFDKKIYWAHIGDSHIYEIKQDSLKQLNEDHTLEYQKKKDGLPLLPGDEHVLTQAMGTKPKVNVNYGQLSIGAHEAIRFLLCTDGLYNLVSEEELLILGVINPSPLCAQALIALAKERGGQDNISVCLLDHKPIETDEQQTISN